MIDKVGVARAHPLAYVIVLLGLNGIGMTPYVLWRRDRRRLWALWRETWPSAVTGGLLSLVAYLLVLTAMRLTQVSYVAALRRHPSSSLRYSAPASWGNPTADDASWPPSLSRAASSSWSSPCEANRLLKRYEGHNGLRYPQITQIGRFQRARPLEESV